MMLSSPANVATCLLAALLLSVSTSQSKPQVKGYYPSYNYKSQPPSAIDWAGYTDVLYFMVIPQKDFSLKYDPTLTSDEAEKLVVQFVAEAQKHNVNPILSTGGWTGSQYFSYLTSSDHNRKRFAKVLVDFAKKRGFVGLELDYEYPNQNAIGCNTRNKNDVVHFGKFVWELRQLWPEASLTAAVSINGLFGASGNLATEEETRLLNENLSYIHLMAYDVFGAWAALTGPIAPLHNTCAPAGFAQSVETGFAIAVKQGFKPSQILLGIPGYAKRLELLSPTLVPTKVGGQTSFYYQNHTTVTPQGGEFDDKPGKDICGNVNGWGGSFLVRELIKKRWLSEDESIGLNGFHRTFDECSGEPFLTNGQSFISYDDTESTVLKAKYARQHNMAGVYFFDTQGPTPRTIMAAGEALRG